MLAVRMPVYAIPERLIFPDPRLAEPSGLLGVGGDLSADRLLLAYENGIFPWFSEGQPILWWSPDPRMVLYPDQLHVPRSLRKRMRRGDYTFTFDRSFGEVIRACSRSPRPGQEGTWITDEMVEAYEELHERGIAHSVEAWQDGELVGGLYGVAIGRCFAGESMFTVAPDASKSAFVTLVEHLRDWGFTVVDCQVHTEHLERFGAIEVPRERFLEDLREARIPPVPQPVWRVAQR